EHHADLGAGQCENVSLVVAANQINNGPNKINQKQDERRPCRRHVIIKDALHVTHGALGGRGDQTFVKSEAQQQGGDNGENREAAFHSASSTVSNSNKHAIVNTTSYATSRAIQNR